MNIGGVLSTMLSSNLKTLNDTFTIVLLDNGTKIILKVNQALLDFNLDQDEALLQPYQVCSFGIIVDNCAKRHMATN